MGRTSPGGDSIRALFALFFLSYPRALELNRRDMGGVLLRLCPFESFCRSRVHARCAVVKSGNYRSLVLLPLAECRCMEILRAERSWHFFVVANQTSEHSDWRAAAVPGSRADRKSV